MKELQNLRDLLNYEIQVIYEAERAQLTVLPRMKEKANSSELKNAIEQHTEETKKHKERLEKIAQLLKIDPSGDVNPSIIGLAAEGEISVHKDASPETLDAAIIAGVQKMEHYEISSYGTATTLAQELGLTEIQDLLALNLKDEKEVDSKLTNMAKTRINKKAEKVASK